MSESTTTFNRFTSLTIGRTDYRTIVRSQSFNAITDGPNTLLSWLETQLGLRTQGAHRANRITEFANLLDKANDALFATSFGIDRWATAGELLDRLDELGISGWEGGENDSMPRLVRDLARATSGAKLEFPSVANRLQRVLSALDEGQTLPEHECNLLDRAELWPAMWQKVLERLNCRSAAVLEASGRLGTSLRSAQDAVRGISRATIAADETLRHVVTRSEAAACEYVGNTLAISSDVLADTVIYCANEQLALRLDACLHRVGLPTMGASIVSPAQPLLQVLPLVMNLCWEPVDPQALLDFLSLPVKPILPSVARKLAGALVDQPGLGSRSWDAAVEEVCSAEWDKEGKIRKTLNEWLYIERTQRGAEVSASLIREVCGRVANWATGRAQLLDRENEETVDLYEAFRAAANQASFLGDLTESQGRTITEPQLKRLLEEATSLGVRTQPHIEAAGGPTLVTSLAEISRPFRRLIWVGLSISDAPLCKWSTQQLQQLRSNGIDIDDGSRGLSALRSAESRGLSLVTESMLAIHLPQDWEQRLHPIWLAIQNCFAADYRPTSIEALIEANDTDHLLPFRFNVASFLAIQPQPKRDLWRVTEGLLRDRTTVSASELQDRLGCPLKWVFNYQASLSPSSIAQLPDDHNLKGTFCHSILEGVFAGGKSIPTVDDACDAVGRMFDERLSRDAAPLAQPDKRIERQKLRNQLVGATRTLISTLTEGGYTTIDIEVELSGQAFEKELIGSVDCVATKSNGSEAIIDFKYSGKRYRELLKDGRAIQLATYAFGRSKNGSFPGVAYLIIADGSLCTPEQSPVAKSSKTETVDGPSIQSVWNQFEQAVTHADSWLTGTTPVPASPLIDMNDWPKGTELVLDVKLKVGENQGVCRYCSYSQLCGISRVE